MFYSCGVWYGSMIRFSYFHFHLINTYILLVTKFLANGDVVLSGPPVKVDVPRLLDGGSSQPSSWIWTWPLYCRQGGLYKNNETLRRRGGEREILILLSGGWYGCTENSSFSELAFSNISGFSGCSLYLNPSTTGELLEGLLGPSRAAATPNADPKRQWRP